jgi:hypothetical protein
MEQDKDIKDTGHIFWRLVRDEEGTNILRAEREEMRAEMEARLKDEKDKEFEPIYMPIAPIEPADGSGDGDYNALNDEYFRLKREYENIESLRSRIKDKRMRAYYSESEIAEKDEEEARRFAAYKTDCEAYNKRHEEVYSFRRLACEAVRYLSKIADSLDNIESSVSSIEDSVEE